MPINGATQDLSKEIEAWISKAKSSVKDFNKKDRKKILTKAARPVTVEARKVLKSQYKQKESKRKPHYRGKGANRVKYTPGNLRRSLSRVILKRSPDAFVGPRFNSGKKEYGGVGQPTDGYYASIWAGSASLFSQKVLEPAATRAAPKVRQEVKKAALAAIVSQAQKRGIKKG